MSGAPAADSLTQPSVHSPGGTKKKVGELDGSLHLSLHGGGTIKSRESVHVPAGVDDDANSVTEGSDDFAFVGEGDDEDASSFCDADETCSADQGFCRRGMSVGEEEMTKFLVEYGDEIKSAAYYGEDGEVIEVPMALIPPDKQPKVEEAEDEEDDDEEDIEKILAPASQKMEAKPEQPLDKDA